ncbi:DUF4345 domain-containing protein [Nocardiopsis ganjiahuensis]|uniref:DUF4345 domain-containing protein n=1 Tax=Nocardiopsis ganjiahuensis TaxID=239984 RepID=UPI00034DEAF8|nr:DUF4345 domain-containing protein [Nocardiopsis ganjiahuensis]
MRSLRYLQSSLLLLALFAVAVGFMDVLFSTAPLPGETGVAPTVDSNYRFFAAIFVAVGLLLLWVSLDPLEHTRGLALWWVSGAVFLGGLARIVSLGVAGPPAPFVYALLAVELVVPPVLVLWHRALTRASDTAAP